MVCRFVALPDIGLKLREQGYNYPNPNGGGNGGGGSSGGFSSGGTSHNELSDGGGVDGSLFHGISSYDAPMVSGNNYNGGSGNGGFGGSTSNAGGNGFGSNGGGGSSGNGFGSNGGGGSDNGFGGSSFGSSGGGNFGAGGSGSDVTHGQLQVIDLGGPSGGNTIVKPVIRQGEPQITKHFYIHEAPEEPENTQVQEKEILVRPQKRYNIIFIKAPAPQNPFGGSNVPIFPQVY